MLADLVQWIIATVGTFGYPGIFIMMTLESSFFPFPSEVAMIPAGCLAYYGEMNIYIAIVVGIAGSIAGALFNYYFAIFLGRPFIIKFGKYFFISEKTMVWSERFFEKHGSITTFVGRLIPAVRQVISFPAGLARMNIWKFLIFTALGAGIWVAILAWLGYAAAGLCDWKEIWEKYGTQVTIGLLVFVAVVLGTYIFIKWRQAKKEKLLTASPQSTPSRSTEPPNRRRGDSCSATPECEGSLWCIRGICTPSGY